MFILHRIPLSPSQKHYVYPVGEYKIATPDSNVTTQGTEMQISQKALMARFSNFCGGL